MKELDNLTDSTEKRMTKSNIGRIIVVVILLSGLIGAVLIAWEKMGLVKKEVKREKVQIPVTKKNPEQDLTFYKNLKDKNESNGKKENIVGLIPPSTSLPRTSEPPPENALKKSALTESSLSPRFTLQVASMKDYQKALRLSDRLVKKGFPSYVISAEIPERGTYYRVRIGHYVTKKAAEEVLEQLNKKGEKEAILARENVMTKTK